MSRPPVRKALSALQIAGIVEIHLGDGTYVKSATPVNFSRGSSVADNPPQAKARTLKLWSSHNDEKIAFSSEGERSFDHLFIVWVVHQLALWCERSMNHQYSTESGSSRSHPPLPRGRDTTTEVLLPDRIRRAARVTVS